MLYGASTIAARVAAVAVRLRRHQFGLRHVSIRYLLGPVLTDRRHTAGTGRRRAAVIIVGLFIMGAGCYWMAQMNLEISPRQVVWPRVVTIVGLSMIFAPINVAAYMYTPTALRGAAVGLFSLLRNEGGSVGTSLAQTIHERRDQFHTLGWANRSIPFNPTVTPTSPGASVLLRDKRATPRRPQDMAVESLAALREQQSSSLAYFDVFWMAAVLAVVLVLLVAFMKRSAAEKGAHIAAE